MKVYLLKDSDLQRLLDNLDRNPEHGYRGGSSQVFNKQERQAYKEAHQFYNYQIRNWIDSIKEEN